LFAYRMLFYAFSKFRQGIWLKKVNEFLAGFHHLNNYDTHFESGTENARGFFIRGRGDSSDDRMCNVVRSKTNALLIMRVRLPPDDNMTYQGYYSHDRGPPQVSFRRGRRSRTLRNDTLGGISAFRR
ncbi:MAG: hypothetical protein AAGU05_03465, partial [Anaerolineaceae bacterium]